MNMLEYRIELLAKKEKQLMINYHYPRISNIRNECSILVFQMVQQKTIHDDIQKPSIFNWKTANYYIGDQF